MTEIGKVREDEILRFLRFQVTESAAATFTESELSTNLSLERGVIWQIHFVDAMILPSTVEQPAQGASEYTHFQITRDTKSALANLFDPDVIALFRREVTRGGTIGTDAGPLWYYWENPHRIDFPLPVLYASPSIYVGLQATSASAQTVRGRIGYTLAKADERLFFRVAQALIG